MEIIIDEINKDAQGMIQMIHKSDSNDQNDDEETTLSLKSEDVIHLIL